MELYVTMEGGWEGITNERGEKMRRDDKQRVAKQERFLQRCVYRLCSWLANRECSNLEERDLDRSNVERWWWHDEKNRLEYNDTVNNTIRVFVSQDAQWFVGPIVGDFDLCFHRSTIHRWPFISRTRQMRKKHAQDACADRRTRA